MGPSENDENNPQRHLCALLGPMPRRRTWDLAQVPRTATKSYSCCLPCKGCLLPLTTAADLAFNEEVSPDANFNLSGGSTAGGLWEVSPSLRRARAGRSTTKRPHSPPPR